MKPQTPPNHSSTVQAQFDPQAQAYLTSAIHAQGPDLVRARELVGLHAPQARVLDIGCGAGHLSFALATLAAEVVAVDPSEGMLRTVAQAATEKSLSNIRTVQAQAEQLPWADACFDVVATRYSAHHWLDLPRALADMRRVVRPGGWVLVIDIEGHEDALVDTHLQTLELLRDRSHVRDHSPSQWAPLLRAAGFDPLQHQSWPSTLEWDSWVTRMRTPAQGVAMIRTLQRDAPAEVQQALSIQPDGSFTVRTGLWWGRAA